MIRDRDLVNRSVDLTNGVSTEVPCKTQNPVLDLIDFCRYDVPFTGVMI